MSNETYLAMMDRLKRAESFLGFDPTDVEQGTDDWFSMRLGVATASRAKEFVAKIGSQTRNSYLCEMVAQVATGLVGESFTNKAMEWGKDHEDDARNAFSFVTGIDVATVPFIYKEKDGELLRQFGCSPDGITSDGGGLELKCPYTSKMHVDFIVNRTIKDDYIWQVQYSLWVSGLPHWYFGSYDPRVSVKTLDYIRIEPDKKSQDKIEVAAQQWIADFDSYLNKVMS